MKIIGTMSATKPSKIQAFALLLCILPALAGGAGAEPEFADNPVHNGKPLSAWVDELLELRSPDRATQTDRAAVRAVRSIGTNAIPWLLRELTVTPDIGSGSLHQNRARFGFWALGEIGSPAIPSLLKQMDQQANYAPSALAG